MSTTPSSWPRLSLAALCAATLLLTGCVRMFEAWNLRRFDANNRKLGIAVT